MLNWIEKIGKNTQSILSRVGQLFLLFGQTIILLKRFPYRFKLTLKEMEEVGVNSFPVVLITATFTGMVLALQSYTGFKRFGAESMVGVVVALSMSRELGPVLTGLIVTGRAGSAMAAELGTMRVTEQIDALYTLSTNPVEYLIVPRFIASLIMLPVLTILADIMGFIGGYLIAVNVLNSNPYIFVEHSLNFLKSEDIFNGLLKSAVFGIIMATICCYEGFYTEGGAEGVGKATTRSVVVSFMLILISDYFLAALLFKK